MFNVIFHVFILLLGVFATLHAVFFIFSRARTWKKFWADYSETHAYSPGVSVLMAVRGLDERIDDTIKSLSRQGYNGKYEVVIVADDDKNAYAYLRKRCAKLKNFRVFLSPAPKASSGKATALLLGVKKSRRGILAFCDSDETLRSDWLSSIVGPLEDAHVGAATGYRMYVPSGFISAIVAAWNNIGLMRSVKKPYVIGGSYAIRKKDFYGTGIAKAWESTVSEDAAVTKKIGKNSEIRFVPSAIVFSEYSSAFSHITEFTTRQLTMIRWYMPGLWKIATALFLFEAASTMLGLALLAFWISSGNSIILLEALLFLWSSALGMLKASIDRRNMSKIAGRKIPKLRYLLADFLAQWLMTYNLLSAGMKKSIRWRGRKYVFDDDKILIQA